MLVPARPSQRGFTLIELLVVIGILAVLLAITLIAINPARQFAQANNTQRRSDVNAILNAVGQYMVDNNGTPPSAINTTLTDISSTGTDLCTDLVPTYIAALPVDPLIDEDANPVPVTENDCASYTTGYRVAQDATNNRIFVDAPSAELEASISASR